MDQELLDTTQSDAEALRLQRELSNLFKPNNWGQSDYIEENPLDIVRDYNDSQLDSVLTSLNVSHINKGKRAHANPYLGRIYGEGNKAAVMRDELPHIQQYRAAPWDFVKQTYNDLSSVGWEHDDLYDIPESFEGFHSNDEEQNSLLRAIGGEDLPEFLEKAVFNEGFTNNKRNRQYHLTEIKRAMDQYKLEEFYKAVGIQSDYTDELLERVMKESD